MRIGTEDGTIKIKTIQKDNKMNYWSFQCCYSYSPKQKVIHACERLALVFCVMNTRKKIPNIILF